MRNWIRRLIHGLFPKGQCGHCLWYEKPGGSHCSRAESPFGGLQMRISDGCRCYIMARIR